MKSDERLWVVEEQDSFGKWRISEWNIGEAFASTNYRRAHRIKREHEKRRRERVPKLSKRQFRVSEYIRDRVD